MRRIARLFLAFTMLFFGTFALAQEEPRRELRTFSQAQLDQILAPIALYPDALLSQILMAATYPGEVFEAASWSRLYPDLRGEQAVRAAEGREWDPSVISLTAFPQVLAMMDERRGWTEDLGEAYLSQPEQVMDTVQSLRARADAAGNLRSSDEIIVQRQGRDYIIESPSPEVVYVPYYDPRYAYGPWWWEDYPPVYWNPWPGYRYSYGYPGFGWGYGITLGSGFFFGSIDWPHRHLRFGHSRPWYYHGRNWHRGNRWSHDHRRWSNHRWRDRDGDGRPNWRDRDRDGDGVPNWRERRGDRDGDGRPNWRDRDRDGDGRPNWRDRGNRGDRGDRDRGRPGRDRSDAGHQMQRGATQLTAPSAAGPFPPQRVESVTAQPTAPRNPPVRQASPRYNVEGGRRERPQPREAVREQPRVAAPAHGMGRDDARMFGAPERAQRIERAAPAAPAARQAAPAPRQAPAAAPARAPVERAAPAPRAEPAREAPRGGRGDGGGRRSRD